MIIRVLSCSAGVGWKNIASPKVSVRQIDEATALSVDLLRPLSFVTEHQVAPRPLPLLLMSRLPCEIVHKANAPSERAFRSTKSRMEEPLQHVPAHSTVGWQNQLAACHACLDLPLERQADRLAGLKNTDLLRVHTCAYSKGRDSLCCLLCAL